MRNRTRHKNGRFVPPRRRQQLGDDVKPVVHTTGHIRSLDRRGHVVKVDSESLVHDDGMKEPGLTRTVILPDGSQTENLDNVHTIVFWVYTIFKEGLCAFFGASITLGVLLHVLNPNEGSYGCTVYLRLE